ncbi:serine/threonine-protein phosphatase 6 regulatory ankyrin repeat subunit A-like [Phymastichus coffea]|uniref:serine/threonine-protein phosphatase 6 regulatory ankyrin repeat subunit A-like n=1 Tax=Phymastichus coffea TaxID=108790 RepID=UPI00273C1E0A|nr:serine/threonine-protein phosphatase 6 regulatory ankyrin repeat subunit A-like [Phymastichus coffea]
MIVDQDVPLETNCYYNYAYIYGNKEIVRRILQSNIDLYDRDEIGQCPIHYLARNDNDGVIDELYGKKFEVDALNNDGETPLNYAASAGLPYTVEFLLNNGAKPNTLNFYSRTPLSAAFSSAKYISVEDGTRYQDVVELLLKHGADPQLQPPGFEDIFETALEYRLLVLLESVISHLALLEKQGMAIISEHNARIINSHPITSNFFKICRQQLTKLETVKINDSLTFYQLLISSDTKIQQYARDSNIISIIRSICKNEEFYWPYGCKIQEF